MAGSPVVRSPLPDVQIPDITIHELAFEKFRNFDERIALTDGISGTSYTFADLLRMCRKITAGLIALGVKKHDVIAIFTPNSIQYVAIQLGSLAAGAAVTTINSGYTDHEVSIQLKQSGAVCLFTTNDLLPTAERATAKLTAQPVKIIVNGSSAQHTTLTNLMESTLQVNPTVTSDPRRDLAALFFSSGTTGLPKGVMLTHRNLVTNFVQQTGSRHQIAPEVRKRMESTRGFRRTVLGHVPMSHMYGNCTVQLYSLMQGCRLIVLPGFTPHTFLAAIQKYKVTYVPLVPPLALFLAKSPLVAKYDVRSVLSASCGAAPLAGDVHRDTCRALGIEQLGQEYGLTEAMCVTGSCFALGFGIKPGSVGVLLPNTEIQILDPQSGTVLRANERGEICVRGPQMMQGYLDNLEATRNALDSAGWLHTGDIGHYDSEGYIYIVDRVKDIIKYKGFQVSPAEVEGVLISHPDIEDAAVIPVPDPAAGELPKALVVKKPGTHITRQQIHAYVKEYLSSPKQLRGGIEFVSTVPRSPSGKILKNELKKRASAATSKL